MIARLDDLFRFHSQALGLRVQRQQLLASNIANADTPNFKARDFDFAAALRASEQGAGGGALVRTSSRHLPGATGAAAGARDALYRVPFQPSVDGNTVEMDAERAQFADNAIRYETNLSVLNAQIKALLAAIQG